MSEWFERYGYAEVADGLLTGALPADAADVAVLAGEGVTRVLNLCEDEEYATGARDAVQAALAAHGIEEERISCVDFGNVLPGALERSSEVVGRWLDAGEVVYLHCRAGWQRSATVAAAALARHERIAPDEALGRIQRRKPSAQPLHHQLEDLWKWWRART